MSNDNRSPMVSSDPVDESPMLGGDRRIGVPCPLCEEPMIRDLVGEYVCLKCYEHKHKLWQMIEEIRKDGEPHSLSAGHVGSSTEI